jgi:hypothetical protein
MHHSLDGGIVEDRSRKLLVRLFWGQALVSIILGLWLTLHFYDTSSFVDYSTAAALAVVSLVFGALPWWIGFRLNRGQGTLLALIYSGASLLAFPIGTVLGGVQLFLLRDISRRSTKP